MSHYMSQHIPYVPFFHLPSVRPAPGYIVEKVDSMLEAGDVIKQSGKELLSALPKDSKMFQVMNQIMNQIYRVNASLKSISPVNGMVHNVPLTDFDSFEIGEAAPAAPPSPPSIPIPTPQPGTSQTTTKKRKATAAFGSEKQQMEGQVEEEEEEDGDGGDEGAGGKKKRFTKEIRTGIYEPCNKDINTEYRCYKVDIKDPRYNTKRGAPTVFIPDKTECHCGKKCDSDADLALHVTEEHPRYSLWKCHFCNHDSPQKDYIWKHIRTQHHNKHLHICQFKNCKQGTNGRKYGNDEITLVWAHMMKCHGLRNPLGCPLCEKTFSGKAIQRKHIASCQMPKSRRGKDFPCHKCDKKYVDQEALDKHLADHEGKVVHPVCQNCGKQLSTSGALKVHI